MVAVEVTGLVEVVEAVPPQAERAPSTVKPSARTMSSCSRVRFLKPRKQSATARAVKGTSGRVSWRTMAAVVDGVTVIVEVAVPSSEMEVVFGLELQV